MSELNFNSNQILRSNQVESDEETLIQREEEIHLPNITPAELSQFASLRQRMEEKTAVMSGEEVDALIGQLVEYSVSLKDRFGEEILHRVLLFHLISPEETEQVPGDVIEKYDLDSESIESKVSEILGAL